MTATGRKTRPAAPGQVHGSWLPARATLGQVLAAGVFLAEAVFRFHLTVLWGVVLCGMGVRGVARGQEVSATEAAAGQQRPSSVAFATDQQDVSAQRGVRFLRAEVARWSREHDCASCHNQGDAARVVFLAGRQAFEPDSQMLQTTRDWLATPQGWRHNQGDQRFSDQRLASIQFAAALVQLHAYDPRPKHRAALHAAARQLLVGQADDGSWQVDTGGILGSPITYGSALATSMAIQVLAATSSADGSTAIAGGRRYLRELPPRATVNAAGILWGLVGDESAAARRARERAAGWLLASQHRSGGWGPYRDYAPEIFDTSVAVIALQSYQRTGGGATGESVANELTNALERAVSYLRQQQMDDGGWLETTRPDAYESYAHRVSTSAWATQALLDAIDP